MKDFLLKVAFFIFETPRTSIFMIVLILHGLCFVKSGSFFSGLRLQAASRAL